MKKKLRLNGSTVQIYSSVYCTQSLSVKEFLKWIGGNDKPETYFTNINKSDSNFLMDK
jgi:hypothetical protein